MILGWGAPAFPSCLARAPVLPGWGDIQNIIWKGLGATGCRAYRGFGFRM